MVALGSKLQTGPSGTADHTPIVLIVVGMLSLVFLAALSPGWFVVGLLFAVSSLVMWWRSRPEQVQAREDRRRAVLESQRSIVDRNYRMEVRLGWRPDSGYDLEAEVARFSEVGGLSGVPRPAIWSYSDALGGTLIRTPGGAVGVMNRRYGPWTPWQWAGVAAGAWAVMHHRR
jgi:hypothetical protein